MATSSEVSRHDDRLEQVLAEYLRAVGEGDSTNREAILIQYPDLAQELEEFFQNCDFMQQCVGRSQIECPAKIGEYEVLEVLGTGTFGVVVKARHEDAKHLVAIKLLRGEQWSTPENVQRFWAEVRKAAKLNHPNLVPAFHPGQHDGQPYYVMRLIEGESLKQRLKDLPTQELSSSKQQRWAAGLAAKVARALHHVHQNAILHRDLKPGNILVDRDGQPHVTDLGLAKHLQETGWLGERGPSEANGAEPKQGPELGHVTQTFKTENGVIVGTPAYMSPEQASGQELTTASDIYSLGVVLYEMLSGQVPIRGATPQETMQRIPRDPIHPPSSVQPKIDKRLERICLKCLEKDPYKRYGSALGLANNLELWLANKPPRDPAGSTFESIYLWCCRQPALAGLLATSILLFLFVTVMAWVTAQSRAAQLEREVLRSNAFAARHVANTVLVQWRQLSAPLIEAAGSEEMHQLMKKNDPARIQKFVEQALEDWNVRLKQPNESGGPFQTSRVLDPEGNLLAADPKKAGNPFENYKGKRDYFDGTKELAERTGAMSVHVSRVFRGDSDGNYRFALAVPIRDRSKPGSPILGILTATLTTDPTMGLPQLHDEKRKAVLIGPKDEGTSSYVILVHPDYQRRQEPVEIHNSTFSPLFNRWPLANELDLPASKAKLDFRQVTDAHYVDPVSAQDPEARGRWLAGFAPVGNTEFGIIVQQRHDEAIPSDTAMLWSGVAVLLGVLFAAAAGGLVVQAITRQREPGS